MKRTSKLLALTLVLIVILAGAYGVSKLNPEINGSSTEEESEQLLFDVDSQQVTVLTVDYSEEMSFQWENDSWYYTADSIFPVNTSRIDSMLSAFTAVTSSKTIEEPESLSQYGLEEPLCTVTVNDGEEHTLMIGDESSMGGERYVSIGDGNVYLTDESVIDSFSYGLMDMVKKEVLPEINDVQQFIVTSGEKSYEIDYIEDSGLAYSDEYVWFYKDGDDYMALDTVSASSFVAKITGLTWGDCVSYNATEEELSEYGFDQPQVSILVNYQESYQVETDILDTNGDPLYDTKTKDASFTLEIGNYADSYCYARIADSNMVYLIDATICDNLLYASYEKLQPDEILVMDFDELTGLDVTVGDESYSLNADDISDELVDVLEEITNLVPSDKGTEKTPEYESELELVFYRDNENFPEVSLVFYKYDSENCLVSLNGTARLQVARDSVMDIVSELTELLG
jgi:hypothetical protein